MSLENLPGTDDQFAALRAALSGGDNARTPEIVAIFQQIKNLRESDQGPTLHTEASIEACREFIDDEAPARRRLKPTPAHNAALPQMGRREMARFEVLLPIAGHAIVEVDADDEADAIEKAFEVVSNKHIEDWEAMESFMRGNTCYCPQPWSAEATPLDDPAA